MDNKTYFIILGAVTALAFIIGRYTAPVKTITETKTIEVQSINKNTDKDQHIKTVIVKKPDGETITTVTNNTETKTELQKQTSVDSSTKTTIYRTSGTTISMVGALYAGTPTYGVSITHNILGPITVGAMALQNSTFGISLGLSF